MDAENTRSSQTYSRADENLVWLKAINALRKSLARTNLRDSAVDVDDLIGGAILRLADSKKALPSNLEEEDCRRLLHTFVGYELCDHIDARKAAKRDYRKTLRLDDIDGFEPMAEEPSVFDVVASRRLLEECLQQMPTSELFLIKMDLENVPLEEQIQRSKLKKSQLYSRKKAARKTFAAIAKRLARDPRILLFAISFVCFASVRTAHAAAALGASAAIGAGWATSMTVAKVLTGVAAASVLVLLLPKDSSEEPPSIEEGAVEGREPANSTPTARGSLQRPQEERGKGAVRLEPMVPGTADTTDSDPWAAWSLSVYEDRCADIEDRALMLADYLAGRKSVSPSKRVLVDLQGAPRTEVWRGVEQLAGFDCMLIWNPDRPVRYYCKTTSGGALFGLNRKFSMDNVLDRCFSKTVNSGAATAWTIEPGLTDFPLEVVTASGPVLIELGIQVRP